MRKDLNKGLECFFTMAKCDICKTNIEKTFLEKPVGTSVKKGKKRHAVCNQCQAKLSMEEILEKL